MKLSTLGLATITLAACATAPAQQIKWQTDLAKAMRLAKRLHRPIMVDFYADW